MAKQIDKKTLTVPVCAACGSAGSISELPDGTTFFHCYTCGGSKMTIVEISLFAGKELNHGK